ncbi:MAG: carboxypeptidase M32 [Planctomycetota bacterium]|jgi:carboxypeptidase Taq|nr:carboxypeptidase M32 [Planctomycetota bacterium]
MSETNAYSDFLQAWGVVADLEHGSAVLQWDQETRMPAKGAAARGKILATLAGVRHDKMVSAELSDALHKAIESVATDSLEAKQLDKAKTQIDRETRIPSALAVALAEAQSAGLHAWQNARAEADFSMFQQELEELVHLNREKASALAGDGKPYDALLDLYEEGSTEADLKPMFAELGDVLAPMIKAVGASKPVDESPAKGHFDPAAQKSFCKMIAAKMGYDFEAGRLDKTTHPFCTTFGQGDVRITWRWQEDDIRPAMYGVMHEAGHGLYEQGLPTEWARTPLWAASGLGMHESQSRLWENMVGRSEAFWHWAMPHFQDSFPDKAGLTPEQMFPALNTCKPSLIRVEADEATYNLHVAVRFEVERLLFAGGVNVADLPELWDQTYQKLLGVRAESISDGVLQDIHWAMGAFGYFPTYTIGNLVCAQLFEQAQADLNDLESQISKGEFAPLLQWLREHVHQHGRRYSTQEMVQMATGKPLTAQPLLNHLTGLAERVYAIQSW